MDTLNREGLPAVLPGENPFRVVSSICRSWESDAISDIVRAFVMQQYIRALNDSMYRDPTPGLRARLITLITLNWLSVFVLVSTASPAVSPTSCLLSRRYVILSMAYIALLMIESRRHARAGLHTRRFWLFRLVRLVFSSKDREILG